MMIKISKGNSKLGNIPNISLIPVKDCGNCEGCKTDCYTVKSYRQYPNVRNAWTANSAAHRLSLDFTEHHLRKYFNKHKPEYFRIHVAGDFLNQKHVEMWYNIARDYPDTKFLAFTKMGHLNFKNDLSNLSIIASQWSGMRVHSPGLRWAVTEGHSNAFICIKSMYNCPGSCTTCKVCWDTSDTRDIIFKKH